MSKQYFRIVHDQAKNNAIRLISTLDIAKGMIVTISPPTRTLEQNSKLWSMLADVSKQVNWYGQFLSPDDWKNVFTASLKKQRAVPGLENDGSFVVLGQSTKVMSKSEFAGLITLIEAFGAEQGVEFSEPAFRRKHD